jgi:hypothetical protein
MKLAAEVFFPTKINNGFFLARKGTKSWVVDFNFRMVSFSLICGWGNFKVTTLELINDMELIPSFFITFKFYPQYSPIRRIRENLYARSCYTYESMFNTSNLWKYHQNHFEYKYSYRKEYFLKIWDVETYINRILYSNLRSIKSLLSTENVYLYFYFSKTLNIDLALYVWLIIIDLDRLNYSVYEDGLCA